MPDLAVIVPTRGRPENIRKVIGAWDFTNAWDHADLVLAIDGDDPEYAAYVRLVQETAHPDTGDPLVQLVVYPTWMPMVHKLNATAHAWHQSLGHPYFALGFAGDDHLPQTIGWAKRYLTALRELSTGMVYGDDGYQGRKLSTEWAVTSDAVRALGRMVPAPVEHMYCDNAMMDLFGGAGALRHLPEIRIEHMHPYAGKAKTDAQYDRVNHRDQFSKDRRAYEGWRSTGLGPDTVRIMTLRKGRPDVSTEPTPVSRPRVAGSGARKVVQRSGPTSVRQAKTVDTSDRTPRHFKNVRAATPEDIMITLADFATQVPADQEIVELGVFQGRTALQLAWGASMGHGAHVTAIDPWDLPGNVYSPPFTDAESRTWAHHWVQTLGYADKITLIQAFSHNVAVLWGNSFVVATHVAQPVGLLFVDGDHTKKGAKRDIVSWAPHLAPGAKIAVDDYGHPDWPGVGEAVDELVAEGVLEPIQIFHDRLAVTRLTVRREYDELFAKDDFQIAPAPTAITSEGVSPSPVPDSEVSNLEAEWEHVDPEGVAALRDSGVALREREQVSQEEAQAIQISWRIGLKIDDLNTFQLRALARAREIVLGARKDKRDAMLRALRDGA